MESSSLSHDELAILQKEPLTLMKCAVHARLLVSGVLYSSSLYTRSGITDDSVVTFLFKGKLTVGVIRKFVSCCDESCNGCADATFCSHYMVVDTYPILPFGIEDSITNAEATHVMKIEEGSG